MKLKSQVENVLKEFPQTRNSDITLMIELWQRYFPTRIKKGSSGEVGIWLKDLYDLPREDNIKRIRAHFQNDLNLYLPSDEKVVLQRRINEDKWREFMGYPPKNNIGQSTLI
jgi:hypothetical protein